MEISELKKIQIEINNELPVETNEKFVGIETIITILLFNGLKLLIPEIREWIKLGFSAIAINRLSIEQKLKEYALEKGLNYKQAQIIAEKIAQKINENNAESILTELQAGS